MNNTERQVGPVTSAITGSLAVAMILAWVLRQFGVELPADIQAAISVLISLIAGYAVRPTSGGGDHRA